MSLPTPLPFTFKTLPKADSFLLEIKLDVYLPPNLSPSSLTPLVFAFHPGGFLSYGRDHIPPWLIELAALERWILVSPDYRLLLGSLDAEGKGDLDAGDCIDDVLAAYEWAVGGQLELALMQMRVDATVDKTKIAAMGFSIGGYLTQLLPSLIPSHLPPLTSCVSLYGVSRPLHPFYHTSRSDPNSLFPSLGFSSTFDAVCETLFAKLWDSKTIAGELDYTPEQKRELEKEGGEGYRGMLWDWAIEHGLATDLLLGKGVLQFAGQGKNDSSSEPSEPLLARLQPLTGPNTPISPSSSNLNPNRPPHPPTFLLHGSADTLVPFADSLWSLEQLTSAGVRCKYFSIPGVDHGFDGAERLRGGEWEEIWREVAGWVRRGFGKGE